MENKYHAMATDQALKNILGNSPGPREINPDREELERLKRSHERYEKYTGAVINALGYIIDSDREQIKLLERSHDCASQSRDKAHIAMQEIAEKLETTVDKNKELEAKLKAALENEKTLREENSKLYAENASLKSDNDIVRKALKDAGAEIPITNYRRTVMVAAEDLKGKTEEKNNE